MYRPVSGMRDVHHTSARVAYVCNPGHPSRAHLGAAGERACSDRFDTRSWGKKNGRMYRRRLSLRRVNTPRPCGCAHALRVHWVSGGTSPISFCFLFVSVWLFEYIYALSASPRDIICAWRRMNADRMRCHRYCRCHKVALARFSDIPRTLI